VIVSHVVDKTVRLVVVDLLPQDTMEKDVLHIKLVYRPATRGHEGEHSLDRRRLDHRRKGLTEVDAGTLRKAADDPTGFIARQRTICIMFVPKNPFAGNHISVRMTRNESPCLIHHHSVVLRLHHRAPVGITKGCTDGGMERRDGGVGHIGIAGIRLEKCHDEIE
jgi:hypothetical protein